MCVQSPLMFKVEIIPYTPYDGPSVANQNSQNLGVFDQKLEGNHSNIL